MPLDLSPDIETLRAEALAAVDDAARAALARQKTPGMDDEYAAKLAEARDLDGDTPLIDAEAEAAGVSRDKMAQHIIDASQRCDECARRIAAIRGPAKAQIKAAGDVQSIAGIRSRAVADLAAIK